MRKCNIVGVNFINSLQSILKSETAAGVITVKNLLYSLVTHLSSGETLQRHDGGVGSVAQEQLAGLDVTSQRSSVKGCLTKCVHSVYLQSEKVKLIFCNAYF